MQTGLQILVFFYFRRDYILNGGVLSTYFLDFQLYGFRSSYILNKHHNLEKNLFAVQITCVPIDFI